MNFKTQAIPVRLNQAWPIPFCLSIGHAGVTKPTGEIYKADA
jgi:hypothetical protein